MSNCGCGNPWGNGNLSIQGVCGDFERPENPDQGQCSPYRVKIGCEAPSVQYGQCPGETPIAVPSGGGFKILTQLFDENCLPILDENGLNILTFVT